MCRSTGESSESTELLTNITTSAAEKMAALLPSLSADVVSRRHSVRGEEPGNVIAADGTRGPAVHLLPQDGRQTSSSHVSCDVETPSVESQTRVSVVLHNDDDSDDDDDDDDAADMETALSIHQTGMMEHDTAMTSSVLIQHTVVDTSSSDGEYECRQQLATDELLTTATDLRSTLQHIQTSVSQPARSSSSVALALHTRHCATQTVQDQWTQTVVEQFTQTDQQFHGDTVDEFSGTTTQHRVNSSASADVRHDRPQNTLDGNSSMWSTMTLDTAQLKTMTRSTQTLIRLRLGADEQLAYNPGGLSLLHTTSSRDAATDLTLTDLMVGDVVQSRDFATQTFGQFTTDEAAGLPSHTPTAHQQHIYTATRTTRARTGVEASRTLKVINITDTNVVDTSQHATRTAFTHRRLPRTIPTRDTLEVVHQRSLKADIIIVVGSTRGKVATKNAKMRIGQNIMYVNVQARY